MLASLGDLLERGAPLGVRTALGWTALLAVGSTCFGMGLGIAAVFPVIVLLALPHEQRPARSVIVLVLGAVATVVGYELLLTYSSWMSSAERKLFAPRAILGVLPSVAGLQGHLVGFGAAALLFDLVGWQERLPSWTQAAGAGALLLLLAAGWRHADGPKRRVLVALAILVLGPYGAIAAGRAAIAKLLGMSLATAAGSSRYHYLPLALLTVLVYTALRSLRATTEFAGRVVYGALCLVLLARAVAFVTHPLSIKHWDAERAEVDAMLVSIHQQVARTPPDTVVRIQNQPFGPSRVLPALLPGWAGMFVVFFPANTVDGRPVRFVVSNQDWKEAQARGGRIAALVETP